MLELKECVYLPNMTDIKLKPFKGKEYYYLIAENKDGITANEISKHFGVTRERVNYVVFYLYKAGKLSRVRTSNGFVYKIKEKYQ
jgi:hypothetical protein